MSPGIALEERRMSVKTVLLLTVLIPLIDRATGEKRLSC